MLAVSVDFRNNDGMTTTLELPDAILSAIVSLAKQEDRTVAAVIADILERSLVTGAARQAPKSLPVINGRKLAGSQPAVSAQPGVEELKTLEIQNEIARYESAFRH
jgi:hypothetical protein